MMRDREGLCPSWDFDPVLLSLSSVPDSRLLKCHPRRGSGWGKICPLPPTMSVKGHGIFATPVSSTDLS